MIVALEILVAIVLAKWGGDLAATRSYDDEGAKGLGWTFILFAIAVAVRAGSAL